MRGQPEVPVVAVNLTGQEPFHLALPFAHFGGESFQQRNNPLKVGRGAFRRHQFPHEGNAGLLRVCKIQAVLNWL